MIVGLKDRETEVIWSGRRSRKLPADIPCPALDKLRLLNRAKVVDNLRNPPSNPLHVLRDGRAGQHSITCNDVCFVWKDGNAHDVEITDDH